MKEEKFIKLKEYFTDILIFDESQKKLTQLTRQLPSIYQMAIDILVAELAYLNDLKTMKDQIYSELFKKIKEKADRSYTAKEIDILIKSDDNYIKLCIEYNKQEMYYKYFEYTVDNIKKISFQIKNYIEIKKFFNGDY
jgi:hypothetical protein